MSFFSFFKSNKTNKRTRKMKKTRSRTKRGGMTGEEKHRQEQMEENRKKWEKNMSRQEKMKREGRYLPPLPKKDDHADHLYQDSSYHDLNQTYKDNMNYFDAEDAGATFGGKKSRRKR